MQVGMQLVQSLLVRGCQSITRLRLRCPEFQLFRQACVDVACRVPKHTEVRQQQHVQPLHELIKRHCQETLRLLIHRLRETVSNLDPLQQRPVREPY
jgi:hypothetical protein